MSAIVALIAVPTTEVPLGSEQVKAAGSYVARMGTRRIGAWEARLISETMLPG